jgi:hypothetical protein
LKICGEPFSVATILVRLLDGAHECVIEFEQLGVLLYEWNDSYGLTDVATVAYTWIIGQRAGNVVVFCVVLIHHGSCDIWDISSSIALSCNIDLEVGYSEQIFEVFEEFNEVLSYFFFRRRSNVTGAEANTNWIFNPEYMSEKLSISPDKSYQSMFVRFDHPYGFGRPLYMAHDHWNGPFSCRNPSRELHPGPPTDEVSSANIC